MDEKQREDVALFRYQVIAPLLSIARRGELGRTIKELAGRTWEIPFSDRSTVGAGTIEDWFYLYRNGGLPALKPSPRADMAQSRKITGKIADAVEELLNARPELSNRLVIRELAARELVKECELSDSCLRRFRKAQGIGYGCAPVRRDLRPFEFESPCDCWQCDVMYGPSLPVREGRMRKTYLYGILDDATRMICHAQFHFTQDLAALKDVLGQAFQKRGIPRRLYMDNAKVFRSKQLLSVAAQLGFQLMHSRPYKPEGRGKIERWFLTVRSSFLARLDLKGMDSIERLNRLLWAWIEGEYHVTLHKGISEAPLDKWLRLSDSIRHAPPGLDMEKVFMSRTSRRVKKDGTFTIQGKHFEAGVEFIGRKVPIRFNPFDLRKVWICAEKQGEEQEAWPVDLEGNRRVRRGAEPTSPPAKEIKFLSIERLADEMGQDLRGGDHDENREQA